MHAHAFIMSACLCFVIEDGARSEPHCVGRRETMRHTHPSFCRVCEKLKPKADVLSSYQAYLAAAGDALGLAAARLLKKRRRSRALVSREEDRAREVSFSRRRL